MCVCKSLYVKFCFFCSIKISSLYCICAGKTFNLNGQDRGHYYRVVILQNQKQKTAINDTLFTYKNECTCVCGLCDFSFSIEVGNLQVPVEY